jgi:hypothetical protein
MSYKRKAIWLLLVFYACTCLLAFALGLSPVIYLYLGLTLIIALCAILFIN